MGIGSGTVGIIPWELAMGLLGWSHRSWIWDCWDGPGKGWELDPTSLGSIHGSWIWDCWDHPMGIGSSIVGIIP